MRWRIGVIAAGLALFVAACSDPVKHPLDDSETRPPTAAAALVEANAMLDEVASAVMAGLAPTPTEWVAASGCGTDPDSPEQGDVDRTLRRTYPELPAGRSAADLLTAVSSHWEHAGYAVGPGAPNMAPQVITRVNGISYSVTDATPALVMAASVPCY